MWQWCPVCVCGDDDDLSMTDDLLEHVVHEHDPDGCQLGVGDSSSISTTLTNALSTVRACSINLITLWGVTCIFES